MSEIKAIAHLNELTKDVNNDYYLRPQVRGTLHTPDIIKRMEEKQLATLNVNGEAFVQLFFKECILAVGEGYNIVTDLFHASVGIEGVILSNQLGRNIPADELFVRMNLTQGTASRAAISKMSVTVAEQPAPTGPVIQSIMNPTKNQLDTINIGKMVLIQGIRLAIKGDKEDEIGIYFTSVEDNLTVRIPIEELSPNTGTKLQFTLPIEVTQGEWKIKVVTQATSSGTKLTKEVRSYEYPNIVTVV